MKTRAIITAIIAAASISSSTAQELLTDGKVWNCVQRMYNDQTGEYDRPYTITVVGDTIIGDSKCKRLTQVWGDDTATMFHFAALERDSRLYLVVDEEQREYLNFNLAVGDADGIEGCVTAIGYITVNGIRTKRLTIERRGYLQYIVEGIGLSDDWQRYPVVNSYYNVLISVELNGVTIFTAEDFSAGTTGIRSIEPATKESPTYDLQGRKVAESRHGIYIKNGRIILK